MCVRVMHVHMYAANAGYQHLMVGYKVIAGMWLIIKIMG